MILFNPRTSGVSFTGAAQINIHTSSATITIAASDEPHGVFEFQRDSRDITVKEGDGIRVLSVERLFGNIGEFIAA